MGIFDSLKNIAESTIKREASKTITNAVNSIGKGKNGCVYHGNVPHTGASGLFVQSWQNKGW